MATHKLQGNVKADDEEDELQFRDTFPGYSDAPILDDEEHAKLLPSYDEEQQQEKVSFWEFKYYQNLFNVDTKQVMERMIWSAIPRPGGATYLHRFIRPNPDLYGPFWICITLVLTIAVSSNIAEYLQSLGTEKAVTYYDYRKVTLTATTLFSYTFILPLAISGFLWYFESTAQFTILEVICIYGYSLAIYIPISILWIVKIYWLQVVLILLGFSLSTSVMILTFWPAVRETRRKISGLLLLVICVFHALLCFGFSVYFFQPQHLAAASSVTVPKGTASLSSTMATKHEDSKDVDPSVHPKNLEYASLYYVKSHQADSLANNVNETNNTTAYEKEKVLTDGIKSNNTLPRVNNKETESYKKKAEVTMVPSHSKTGKGSQTLLFKTKAVGSDLHNVEKS